MHIYIHNLVHNALIQKLRERQSYRGCTDVQGKEIGMNEMIWSVSCMSNESNYDLGVVQSCCRYDGFLFCLHR